MAKSLFIWGVNTEAFMISVIFDLWNTQKYGKEKYLQNMERKYICNLYLNKIKYKKYKSK